MNKFILLIISASFLGLHGVGVQVDVYNKSKDPIWISFVNNGEDRLLARDAEGNYSSVGKAYYRSAEHAVVDTYVIKVDSKASAKNKQRIWLGKPIRLRMLIWTTDPGAQWHSTPSSSYFSARPFPYRVYQFEVAEGKDVYVEWDGNALKLLGKGDIFLNPRDIFIKNIKESDIKELYPGTASLTREMQTKGSF